MTRLSPQKPQAFSHMLWFFILPCLGFLLWAGFTWIRALGPKTESVVNSELVLTHLKKIELQKTPGDRWQAAYALSSDLQKFIKDDKWEGISEKDKDLIYAKIESLLVKNLSDLRLAKYLVLSLGQIKDEKGVKSLRIALKSENSELKFFAAWSLLSIFEKNKESLEKKDLEMIASWLKEKDPGLRKISASFLVQTKSIALIDQVASLLKDGHVEVKWNAAVALASIKDPRSAPVLKEMFDLKNIRILDFKNSKDLYQVIAPAYQAAEKLGNEDILQAAILLRNSIKAGTPEGNAILAAIPDAGLGAR